MRDAVFRLALEVVKAGADQRRIEVVDVQLRGLLAGLGERKDGALAGYPDRRRLYEGWLDADL